MQELYNWVWREDGQTMAEYGVVLAVITIAVFGALALLSGSVVNALTRVAGYIALSSDTAAWLVPVVTSHATSSSCLPLAFSTLLTLPSPPAPGRTDNPIRSTRERPAA